MYGDECYNIIIIYGCIISIKAVEVVQGEVLKDKIWNMIALLIWKTLVKSITIIFYRFKSYLIVAHPNILTFYWIDGWIYFKWLDIIEFINSYQNFLN